MTPRTRTSNKDSDYKVYYSKKVPQQVRFPHKKKKIRRPDPAGQDGVEKRQMKFLPEKMRHHKVQEHSDIEGEETGEETARHEVPAAQNEQSIPVNKRGAKKRESNNIQEEHVSGYEPTVGSSKRQRRPNAPKSEPSRTLRRQSTMTQLAEGRWPSFGDDEPDYKPIKRRSRVSSSGAGMEMARDKRQRTLTQMVPGMGRLSKEELEELRDLDADLDDDRMTDNRLLQSLVEKGAGEVHEVRVNQNPVQDKDDSPVAAHPQSSVVVPSIQAKFSEVGDNYQPTQFIETPTLRTRQTPQRTSTKKLLSTGPAKSTKSRFNLLSTPEKRQIFEIPSSQSPAESVLSIQVSPQKSNRSLLRERDDNVAIVAETPSKRQRVALRQPMAHPSPPARMKRFENTIQDSEDEGSELEGEIATQQPSDDTDPETHGNMIGADTQAVLLQINRACASGMEKQEFDCQDLSHEPEKEAVQHQSYRPSPELGESWAPVCYDDEGPQFDSYRSSYTLAKSQSYRYVDTSKKSLPPFEKTDGVSQLDLTTQAPLPADTIPSTPPPIQARLEDDLTSTPMVIRDESSDEEEAEPEPTPLRRVRRIVPEPPAKWLPHSADLDGEPVQVPRSPSADQETQHSHSSKAEQQLQNEWLSYTQHVHAHGPKSSSVHATVDASSYNLSPQPPKQGASIASSHQMQHSQATTVDELTPKKIRTQQIHSEETTPHRLVKSQPFISPEKPPSLFIPSSFPSPSRAAIDGWSSPVMAKTQALWGSSQLLDSLEDFSIPLPPPFEEE